jgi:hypothetical protein
VPRTGTAWTAAAALAAVLGGTAVGWSPLVLVVLVALVGLVLAVTYPAAAVIASAPVLLFGATVAQYPVLGLADYGDEAVVGLLAVALAIRWLAGLQPLRYHSPFGWIAGFLGAGLLSGVVADVPLPLLLAGAALAIKGWLYAFLVAQVDWTTKALRALLLTGAVVVSLVFAVSVVNLAAPAAWTALAGAGETLEYRWALPSLIGPFLYAINYGQVLSLVTGALSSLALCLRGRARTVAASGAAVAGLLTVLSFRRLAILAVLVGALVVLVARRSTAAWAVLVAALPLSALGSFPLLTQVWQFTVGEYLTASTAAARTLLTVGSWDVAVAHAPFGAGFGRYGSFLAGEHYSPEYYAAGFHLVWGLEPDPPNNEFLTDTFWPAILGEAGFVGALLYVAAVVAVFRLAVRLFRTATGPTRTVALMTATVWAQVLVLTPGGAVLTMSTTSCLPFLLLGVLCRLAGQPPEDPPNSAGAAPGEPAVSGAAGGRASEQLW